MKIAVADLKKALAWIESNSHETHIDVKWSDGMVILCKDKYQVLVEITLSENNMLPKIKKETFL
jgi:hypothetical protein